MSGLGLTRRSALGLAMAGAMAALLKPFRARGADTAMVRRGYVKGRFGQMHYRIAKPANASERPLLCLHSSPNSGRIYETFLGEMGTDRITAAADTPGFGDSDPPPSVPDIADYANAMGDFIDKMGFESVDLIGYHTGSMIATELALLRPGQVGRVVLIAAPLFTEAELAELHEHFAPVQLSRDGSHLAATWAEHVHWAMPGWTLDHVATQFPDTLRRPAISWWGHNAAFNYPLADKLSKVRQPILVLNPQDDLHAQTQRAGDLINEGGIKELPGWGHGFLDIHTQEAANMVRGFLSAEG
jgi:pimeloyl-ACP methyl ester carboxylesterase